LLALALVVGETDAAEKQVPPPAKEEPVPVKNP
jgi:hypothetical protein